MQYGRAVIDPKLIEEYSARCAQLIKEQIAPRPDKFFLRISNIGKPTCMLQAEQKGFNKAPNDNFFSVKMLYGGSVEALAILILKASGVNVESEQVRVKTEDGIDGTYDVIIDGKMFDIKSASAWSFEHKFKNNTIQKFFEHDDFGYTAQVFSYAKAAKVPVGGFIAVNKENGEFAVLDAEYDQSFEAKVFAKIDDTLKVIRSDSEFTRCYSDHPELFYKRPSGHRVLQAPCTFCNFKFSCWPELQIRPSLVSTAKIRPLVNYTYIEKGQEDNPE